MTIELIYDADCPNVAKARSNLAAALAAIDNEPRWTEWDRGAADSPSYVRGYGSPTVLVNGKDASGDAQGDSGSCCRLYRADLSRFDGAPSVEQIVAALKSNAPVAVKDSPPAAGWIGSLVMLPTIGAILLPVGLCPACWPFYVGLLSAVGLGFLLDATYLVPLTGALLALAVGALAIGAQTRRGYGPFLLGLAASAVAMFGKFLLESDAAMYGGVAMLVAASVWNAWPVRGQGGTCLMCSGAEGL